MKPQAFIFDARMAPSSTYTSLCHGATISQGICGLSRHSGGRSTRIHLVAITHGTLRGLWEVTSAALRSSVNQLRIEANEAQFDRVMQGYHLRRHFQTCGRRSSL
jgi:hypothetical protein